MVNLPTGAYTHLNSHLAGITIDLAAADSIRSLGCKLSSLGLDGQPSPVSSRRCMLYPYFRASASATLDDTALLSGRRSALIDPMSAFAGERLSRGLGIRAV